MKREFTFKAMKITENMLQVALNSFIFKHVSLVFDLFRAKVTKGPHCGRPKDPQAASEPQVADPGQGYCFTA